MNYKSEDSLDYKIKAIYCNSKLRLIFECKIKDETFTFFSNYSLQFLKDKFKKVLKLEKFNQFINILKDNIKKEKLVIKPIYKNIVKTIWETFPNDKSNKEDTFTLILNKKINKNLSILFFSTYETAKKVVDEMESQGQLVVKSNFKENNYHEITYSNGFLLENSIFLTDTNLEKEEKLKKFYEMIKKIKNSFL